jgi:hypothetical protein
VQRSLEADDERSDWRRSPDNAHVVCTTIAKAIET